ncbi:MAG: transcription antitermination factor NusB [Puniceicoccales bacterium]|jgi:N utilization substance protein B|nr:transcription antitermination factor NusB [Puniceicoccales bacterium]
MHAEIRERGASARHANRIAAVQFLYLCVQREEKAFSPELFSDFCQMLAYAPANFPFARELIQGVLGQIPFIDGQIASQAIHWKLSRMAKVDLCILRLALYELFFSENIPTLVIIDEAIEIAKALSSSESGCFINGLLDRLKDRVERPLRQVPAKASIRLVLPCGNAQ